MITNEPSQPIWNYPLWLQSRGKPHLSMKELICLTTAMFGLTNDRAARGRIYRAKSAGLLETTKTFKTTRYTIDSVKKFLGTC